MKVRCVSWGSDVRYETWEMTSHSPDEEHRESFPEKGSGVRDHYNFKKPPKKPYTRQKVRDGENSSWSGCMDVSLLPLVLLSILQLLSLFPDLSTLYTSSFNTVLCVSSSTIPLHQGPSQIPCTTLGRALIWIMACNCFMAEFCWELPVQKCTGS